MRFILFVLFFGFCPALIVAQSSLPGDNHFTTAENFRKNAQVDSAIVYYQKAAEFFQQSGEMERQVNAYNQLGIIYTRQDKYEPAKQYLEAARDLVDKMPERENLAAANIFISLGVLYAAEKNYVLSLHQHFRSLGIRRALLGQWHADVATNYGNIGNVYLRKNQADSAIYFHRLSMAVREKLFGENSVEIIESYTGLGNSYKVNTEYTTALSFYEKALANKILQRGTAHKDLGRYYSNISELYFLLGKNELGDYYKILSPEVLKD